MNEYMEFQLSRPVTALYEKPVYSIVLSDTKPELVHKFVERLLIRLTKDRSLSGAKLDDDVEEHLWSSANRSLPGVTRLTRVGFRKFQSYTFESLYDLGTPQAREDQLRILRSAVESESFVTFTYGDTRRRVNTVFPVKLYKKHFVGFHADGFRSYSYEKLGSLKLSLAEAVDDEGRFVEPEIQLTFTSSSGGNIRIGAYRREQENPRRFAPFNKASLKAKTLWQPDRSIDWIS